VLGNTTLADCHIALLKDFRKRLFLKDLRDVEGIGKKVLTQITPFLQFKFHPIP
jgi:hypothetical protein